MVMYDVLDHDVLSSVQDKRPKKPESKKFFDIFLPDAECMHKPEPLPFQNIGEKVIVIRHPTLVVTMATQYLSLFNFINPIFNLAVRGKIRNMQIYM